MVISSPMQFLAPDASFIEIIENLGEVRLKETADYETKDSYTFDVIASDGLLSDTKTVTVNITRCL